MRGGLRGGWLRSSGFGLRGASGGPSFTPEALAGLVGWWVASDLTVGEVTEWAGRVGPTFGTVNGTPEADGTSVLFTAADSDRLTATLAVSQPWTVFAYMSDTDANSGPMVGLRNSGVDYLERRSSAWRARSGGVLDISVTTDADPHTWMVVGNGASSRLGVDDMSATGTLSNVISQLTLANFRSDAPSTHGSGRIYELVVCTGDQQASLTAVRGHFEALYG